MKKTAGWVLVFVISAVMLSGCAGESYNPGYNSYESPNDRAIDQAISNEMNSLSSQDIAQLNKLK